MLFTWIFPENLGVRVWTIAPVWRGIKKILVKYTSEAGGADANLQY